MIRLIAFDVDGTLANSLGQVSDRTKRALQDAMDHGKEVLMASGRDYQEASGIFAQCGVRMNAICVNGAEVRDRDGNVKVSFGLTSSDVERMESIRRKTNTFLIYHTDSVPYSYNRVSDVDFYADRFFMAREGEDIPFTRNFTEYLRTKNDFLTAPDPARDAAVLKAEFLYTLREDAEKILACFPDDVYSIVTGKNLSNIEITAKGISKGMALEAYCTECGIKKDEVAVFGDSLNDLTMFERFPHSFAVANADDEVKSIASAVTLSNDEDGVAIVIEEIIRQQS